MSLPRLTLRRSDLFLFMSPSVRQWATKVKGACEKISERVFVLCWRVFCHTLSHIMSKKKWARPIGRQAIYRVCPNLIGLSLRPALAAGFFCRFTSGDVQTPTSLYTFNETVRCSARDSAGFESAISRILPVFSDGHQ